jgi:hypothetical protein
MQQDHADRVGGGKPDRIGEIIGCQPRVVPIELGKPPYPEGNRGTRIEPNGRARICDRLVHRAAGEMRQAAHPVALRIPGSRANGTAILGNGPLDLTLVEISIGTFLVRGGNVGPGRPTRSGLAPRRHAAQVLELQVRDGKLGRLGNTRRAFLGRP